MSFEANLTRWLDQKGWALPAAAEPKGVYRPVLVTGNRVITSGHLPIRADGTLITGRLGEDLTREDGYEAARWAMLGILASIRKTLGSLDRVDRVEKLAGWVASTEQFFDQPAVLNGASELLAEIFGPNKGIGVRSALGANSLPLSAAVEIEAVFLLQ